MGASKTFIIIFTILLLLFIIMGSDTENTSYSSSNRKTNVPSFIKESNMKINYDVPSNTKTYSEDYGRVSDCVYYLPQDINNKEMLAVVMLANQNTDCIDPDKKCKLLKNYNCEEVIANGLKFRACDGYCG